MTKNIDSISIPQMKEYLKDKKVEKIFGGRIWILKGEEANDNSLYGQNPYP